MTTTREEIREIAGAAIGAYIYFETEYDADSDQATKAALDSLESWAWPQEEMTSAALTSVLAERERQEAKWGQQNHDPVMYLAILMEEVGELAQAALHTRFGGHAAAGLREEAVHTAAVALAIVECLDRGKWRWPGETL